MSRTTPSAPADLDKDGKAEWTKLLRQLNTRDDWRPEFVDALERYVRARARARHARAELERLRKMPAPEEGDAFVVADVLAFGSTGQLTEHPLSKLAAAADRDAAAYAKDLRITPSSRAEPDDGPPKPGKGRNSGKGAFGGAFSD